MMKRVLPALVGLMIFLGVGYYWAYDSQEASSRLASASVDACYASRGYADQIGSGTIPDEVVNTCTDAWRVHEEGRISRLLIAAAIGLVAGGIAMVLLGLLLRGRRTEPA